MSRNKRILVILLGLAFSALLALAFMPRPVSVELASVVRGPFRQTVNEEGKTRAREKYEVSAPLVGILERISLEPGDPVKKGALLAAIQPQTPALYDVRTESQLRERVGSAEATKARAGVAVARAEAALKQANADLERSRQLAAKGFISPTQLERNQLTRTLAQRDLQAARFEQQVTVHETAQARAALSRIDRRETGERWQIHSPVDGQVLKVMRESEGPVQIGAPLLEIADPTDLEIVADVLTTDAVQIKPGDGVTIDRYGATRPLTGRVRLVEPAAFTKVSALGVEEQRVNVIIDFTSPQSEWSTLGDGYRVDVRILVFDVPETITVPVSALFRAGDHWAVFVADRGRARKREVEISRRNGQDAAVSKGLTPGEQVIVYPADTVRDGVRIEART